MTGAAPARAAVADLRQYTLKPGCRDALIDLFDRYFVDGQEDVGIHIVGQFRDLDDPDRFVWLRGFDSLDARAVSLPEFYYGPVWRAHRDHANETMLDSDNALLLKPLRLGAAYPSFDTPRTEAGAADSVVAITVYYRDRPIDEPLRELVSEQLLPALTAEGSEPVAAFVTEPSENNFSPLPLRDEHVIVWINRFDNDDDHAIFASRLARSTVWRDRVLPALEQTAKLELQQLRLRPTLRSHLR
ncbi:MAG: NIPSNAP family protein [Jatrophihabitans sp.]